MTQSSPIIGSGKSGLEYRQEDNAGKQALLNHHKGAVAPDYAEAGTIWLDDSETPWILRLFDGASWIPLGQINASADSFVPMFGTTALGMAEFGVTMAGAAAIRIASTDTTTGGKARINLDAKDAGGTSTTCVRLLSESKTVTAGDMDGALRIDTVQDGTLAARLAIGAGVYTPSMADPGLNGIAAQIMTANAHVTGEVSLADDTAFHFVPGVTSGFICAHAREGNSNFRMMAHYSAASGHGVLTPMNIGSSFNGHSGVLNGTTGTDGKVNFSAHTNGRIYIENRSGATVTIKYTIIG